MVKKYETTSTPNNNIKADVIILGCNLPGIVTAHKLKKKFGDTMDIVVIDLGRPSRDFSKFNVVSFKDKDENSYIEGNETDAFIENFHRRNFLLFSKELDIVIPEVILTPERVTSPLNKIFEHKNGTSTKCATNFHDFNYLTIIEKFELNQYQRLIDESMKDLFHTKKYDTESERKKLLYYDQTTMERHICESLLFPTSREIMRTMVRLICSVPTSSVSVLFYLHQCYRNNGCKNLIDGNNMNLREKLLGYCRKILSHKLQQGVADITVLTKSIKEIRTHSDEQVILETMKGESNYVCNLLAMALRPDELHNIRVDGQLFSENGIEIARNMLPGQAKKFMVKYETSFWRNEGYSGEILSVRGPILWAMERPRMYSTGCQESYASLVGYLKVQNFDGNQTSDSKRAVLEQLVNLFGDDAATPVSYSEKIIDDLFVPCCGDYVALISWINGTGFRGLEWGTLDIYRAGDITAAIAAGHAAYLRLSSCIRPQAQTYEDISAAEIPTRIYSNTFSKVFAKINIVTSVKLVVYTFFIYAGIRIVRSYMKKQ